MKKLINHKWENPSQKFIIMNSRLELLLRKNQGKLKIKYYENILINSGFDLSQLEYVDLEEADKIMSHVKEVFTKVEFRSEFLKSNDAFIESDLMRNIYMNLNELDTCYIYTDDFEYCGIYKVNSKLGFEMSFNVAKKDYQNTCFLLDMKFRYSFTINYYDESHNDQPNTFDIQLSASLI
jgi:hypothetical protein